MTRENRRKAIAQDLLLGRQALEAARALCERGLFNDSLSRLYYGLYHHVVALLLSEGVEPSRHSALPGLLGQHFRENGVLSAVDIGIVGRTFTFRSLADYERTFIADAEVVNSAFGEVEPLVQKICEYLSRNAWY